MNSITIELESFVDERMTGKKYFMGYGRLDGKLSKMTKFYLVYDFVSVLDGSKSPDGKSRISTVWFYVEREDGKKFFRFLSQPKIRVILGECFDFNTRIKIVKKLNLIEAYFTKVCKLVTADLIKLEKIFYSSLHLD